jgi:hypothetical protein
MDVDDMKHKLDSALEIELEAKLKIWGYFMTQ